MRTVLLGCKGTTLDLLSNLNQSGKVKIDAVITLSEENAQNNNVAFYQGDRIVKYCQEHNIDCHVTSSYHLKDNEDQQLFEDLEIDLLLVLGWERLIPEKILKMLGKFACGMHGSAYGLPKGRGRSPLNWSILTHHKKFITYLFKYDPGMDDGDIIGFKSFDINEFDSISSLHMKNRIVMQQLLERYYPLIKADEVEFFPQPPDGPTFYPKRTPQDGAIDWRQTTNEVYDLIRAVSFPYPSAFSETSNGEKVIVHKAYPFDTGLFDSYTAPGTVLDVSVALDQLVVKTGSGALLLTEIEGVKAVDVKVGEVLKSADSKAILADIVTRYPEWVKDNEKEIK